MNKIPNARLKSAPRPTTVPRSKVRKIVAEVYSVKEEALSTVVPVFAVYVSVKDLSLQRAQEKFTNVKAMISRQRIHELGQFFFLPTNGEDRLECVWPKYVTVDKKDAEALLQTQKNLLKELQKRAL